ncbi:hypothetical protein [Leptolyngbya sp. FACHB-541]|uniref:hypothetical protein n=1 Tax=Leptolyngbya sp. FACHB-541 TaxID=2692810 RepID=UPI001688FFC0|nr:hypothetical protein [Leptolyngbya sp. FACHB-541]
MSDPLENLPQSDPKLKEAAAEIDAICKKYGIAAFYGLASSTHAEFKLNFPKWSMISIEEQGFRFRAKSAEPERSEASIHLAYSLRDIAGLMFQNLEALTQAISQRLDIEHTPFYKIWDLDGWQKPSLGAAPFETIDFKKKGRGKNKKKGFG